MKNSYLFVVVVLASILQIGHAAAQLKTQTIDYKQADTALEGYLTYDATVTAKRPGVLLLHRRDGMTEFTRKHSDMIAKLGYVVLAADIFGKGVLPKDIPEMQVETAKYNQDRLLMRRALRLVSIRWGRTPWSIHPGSPSSVIASAG